jgi:hypothetical protein
VEKIEGVNQRHGAIIGVLADEILQMKKTPGTKQRFGFQVVKKD